MQSEDQNDASGTCFLLSTYLASHCAVHHSWGKEKKKDHRKATHSKADPALLTNEKKGRNATQGVPRHPRERSGWTTTRTTAQIRHNLALAETSCLFFFCSHIKLHCWIKRNDLRAKHVWQFMGYIGWFCHHCHHQLCKWVLWISGDGRSFVTSQRNDKFSSFSQSTAQNVHGTIFCFVFSIHLNEVDSLPRIIEV